VPMENHGIKTMSLGLITDPDTPVIWRGPMVMKALDQFLTDVKWGTLDFMIIDLPPGTGDAQLTLTQRVPLTGAVVVTTPLRRSICCRQPLTVPVPVPAAVPVSTENCCPPSPKASQDQAGRFARCWTWPTKTVSPSPSSCTPARTCSMAPLTSGSWSTPAIPIKTCST